MRDTGTLNLQSILDLLLHTDSCIHVALSMPQIGWSSFHPSKNSLNPFWPWKCPFDCLKHWMKWVQWQICVHHNLIGVRCIFVCFDGVLQWQFWKNLSQKLCQFWSFGSSYGVNVKPSFWLSLFHFTHRDVVQQTKSHPGTTSVSHGPTQKQISGTLMTRVKEPEERKKNCGDGSTGTVMFIACTCHKCGIIKWKETTAGPTNAYGHLTTCRGLAQVVKELHHQAANTDKIHTRLDVPYMDPHLLSDWSQLTENSGFVSHQWETLQPLLEYCLSYSGWTGAPLQPACNGGADYVGMTSSWRSAQKAMHLPCKWQFHAKSAWKFRAAANEKQSTWCGTHHIMLEGKLSLVYSLDSLCFASWPWKHCVYWKHARRLDR